MDFIMLNIFKMKAEKTSKPKAIQSSPYDNDAAIVTGHRNQLQNKKK